MTTKLWFRIDDRHWVSVLSIPASDFGRFALTPLKWLRFLGSAIYGREGVLLIGPDGVEVQNYAAGPRDLREHYYYFSQGKSSASCGRMSLNFVRRPTSIPRCSSTG
jgi:hypothetical protein